MCARKLSEKYNYSCLKIFEMISLFAKKDAEFSEVIQLFSNKDGSLAQKSNVLLNKYLNTLDIFGVKIKKKKNKYYLQKMPFTLNLDEKDLYAVNLIKSALSIMPRGKNKEVTEQFLSDLAKRYDAETKNLDKAIDSTRNYDLSFYFMKFEKRLIECEQYCQNKKPIEIVFTNQDGEETELICEPREIKYFENLICFSVYSNLTQRIYDIPVDAIKQIKEFTGYVCKKKKCTTVVFRIKGGLAKRYKLRDWERTSGMQKDGTMLISNSGEDFNTLLIRLFKYQDCCEVLTPKYLRNKLKYVIEKTLKNYE